MCYENLKEITRQAIINILIQHFEADFKPQNPEFRINHENFHPCSMCSLSLLHGAASILI